MSTNQQGQTVHANGIDIYYEERGQGQPLILIHGGVMTGDSWEAYLPAFAERYRVIMPDSRGHGRSTNDDHDLSFGLLADDVAALAQALGLEKPLILGYSDGGQVTIEIGMRYPELAKALVIGGAYTELTASSIEWVQSSLGAADDPNVDIAAFESADPGFARFLARTHGPEKWKTLLKQIKPMWNATLNYTAADWAKIVAPALVIVGDRDGFVTLEEGISMYRLLTNAEFAAIPAASHNDLIVNEAKVALAQTIIMDFLQRQEAGRVASDE